MKNIALFTLILIISSCTSTYGGGSSDAVKIYTSTFSNTEDSQRKAQTHCDKFNKDAKFVRSSRVPAYDEFQCVDKAKQD